MSSGTLEWPARQRAREGPDSATARPSYRTLFAVDFKAAIIDADIQRLNSVLDMATHLQPKLYASPVHPGVSRLDFFSGLFLLRGEGPNQWRLEARTWGTPLPETVQEWHLIAAHAARLLDPSVPDPIPLNRRKRPRAAETSNRR
jgi:hypothetical protein